MPRNEFSQRDERHTLKTVKHWWKKLKTIQRNGKICCVFRLEEIILLKYSYQRNLHINAISIKISMIFFTKLKQIAL